MNNEKKLLSVFEELRAALLACNEKKLDKLISNDYQGFSLNGTIEDKTLILQTFKPGGIEITIYTVEDIHCEMSNTLGIITGKGRIEGRYGEYEFQHEVLFTDIFKLINSSWQYYKSQVTEIK
jgi:hypothetical protein